MPYAHNNTISQDPIEGGIEITDLQYAQAVDGMAAGLMVSIENGFELIPPPASLPGQEPVESGVPEEISRFQGMAQLHIAGLLASVEAIMADPQTDPLVVLAWKNVQVFRRYSPMILAIAPQLGLNDEFLDQFFIAASKNEA